MAMGEEFVYNNTYNATTTLHYKFLQKYCVTFNYLTRKKKSPKEWQVGIISPIFIK